MRLLRTIAAAILATIPLAAADATILQLTFTGSYSAIYHSSTQQTEQLPAPRSFAAIVTLPITTYTVNDQVIETNTFYDTTGMTIDTPFRASVGPDPYGVGLAGPPTESVAEIDMQAFRNGADGRFLFGQSYYDTDGNGNWWEYGVGVTLSTSFPSLPSGTAYAVTPDILISTLTANIGRPASFGASWDTYYFKYEGGVGRQVYTDGLSWSNPTATLTTVAVLPDAPEPATWAMMVAGFGLLGIALRRNRRLRTPVIPAGAGAARPV